MTVSRNAKNDFRTESERLAYGSRPYMQFPVFGGGGARARYARSNLKLISPKRLQITDKVKMVIYEISAKVWQI